MKVFISWSGALSRKLAEAFRNWLPGVLQSVQPYFTPDDIEKGARWEAEIAGELETSEVGVFCLTRESLSSLWIAFEAGAISRRVGKSRVCPILFGIDATDVEGPLVQFQATPFTEPEMRKLLGTINAATETPLEKTVIDRIFDKWWTDLEGEVATIRDAHREPEGEEARSDRELLEELLTLTRQMASRPPSAAERARPDPTDRYPDLGDFCRIVTRDDLAALVLQVASEIIPPEGQVPMGDLLQAVMRDPRIRNLPPDPYGADLAFRAIYRLARAGVLRFEPSSSGGQASVALGAKWQPLPPPAGPSGSGPPEVGAGE